MKVEYTVQIWQEGHQYLAHAMPLDIISSGATPDQARRALYEAIELFLATASDLGTLNDILIEAGYRLREHQWISPSWVSIERHSTSLGV